MNSQKRSQAAESGAGGKRARESEDLPSTSSSAATGLTWAKCEATLRGPAITAHVDEVEEVWWGVEGGIVRITLASTAPLTDEDVEAVCDALDGESYGVPADEVEAYFGDEVFDALDDVLEKLPEVREGQQVPAGAVLVDVAEKQLRVTFRSTKAAAGTKLLGVMDHDDWRLMQTFVCPDDEDVGLDEEWHGSTLSNVQLAE